jgi:hypothetical protein
MKVKCEVCGNLGQLQHLSENYYRVKHYLGSIDGKLRFEYHKQSLEYIKGVLVTSNKQKDIDPIDQKNIDLKLNSNGSESLDQCGRSLAWLGHRPPTPTTRVQIPATAPSKLICCPCFVEASFTAIV